MIKYEAIPRGPWDKQKEDCYNVNTLTEGERSMIKLQTHIRVLKNPSDLGDTLDSSKDSTNSSYKVKIMRNQCIRVFGFCNTTSMLRSSNIPWIIGLHCLLLLYLISLGHVFDIQRKFTVANEGCKRK